MGRLACSLLALGILLSAAALVACEHNEDVEDISKRFDIDMVKKDGGASLAEEDDVAGLIDGGILKRFDPYSKRFDPYSKRFDPYSKRFDPYSKRFDPWGVLSRRRRFDLPTLDSRAFYIQLG